MRRSGWGQGWATQGTRTSSSDSAAGSALHGCLPVRQVSAYETPESPGQAVASLEVGPLEALRGGGGGESHTIPCLAWRVPETALDVWAERWRDGGIEVVAAARGHREGLD